MNAFYISCEERLDVSLRSAEAAVAGDPADRTGIILTSNYNARKKGVRTAMTVFEAKKLCPGLVLVKPNHSLYSQVSERIMELLRDFSPVVEQNSIDEAWLDMTNMDRYFGIPFYQIAKNLQVKIYEKEQIPCSIGISYNKFLSKMAADIKKPNGITMLDKDNIRDILWPLDIAKMHGCGRVTAEKLKKEGINTIGELAGSDIVIIKTRLGDFGVSLYNHANGKDEQEGLCDFVKAKSISRETTLSKDTRDIGELEQMLFPLIEDVARQIREKDVQFSTVHLTMKYNDFTRITRQKKVGVSTGRDIILDTIKELLKENKPAKPVRLIGAGVSDIRSSSAIQLSLFDNNEIKEDDIYKVIDEKNRKYGRDIIKRGFHERQVY
jgi:DNA polymerase-4